MAGHRGDVQAVVEDGRPAAVVHPQVWLDEHADADIARPPACPLEACERVRSEGGDPAALHGALELLRRHLAVRRERPGPGAVVIEMARRAHDESISECAE